MSDLIKVAADMDDIRYRIHCAAELVYSVHTSITKGDCEPDENSFDALFGSYCLLRNLAAEMDVANKRLWKALPSAQKE